MSRAIEAAIHSAKCSLNRCFVTQGQYVADTFTVGAFFVAVITGCLTECTVVPIRCLASDCVNAIATSFTADFGTSTICDRQVVARAATL